VDEDTSERFDIPEKLRLLSDLAPKLAGEQRQKALSLADAQVEYRIRDLAKCFRRYLETVWGTDLTETICGTAAEFAHKVHIKVYNSVSYRYQPFQKPNEVDKQLLRCTAK
jgi:hypothetical protein